MSTYYCGYPRPHRCEDFTACPCPQRWAGPEFRLDPGPQPRPAQDHSLAIIFALDGLRDAINRLVEQMKTKQPSDQG